MPVSQAYTFKVINFGDTVQEYAFNLVVSEGAASPGAGDDAELGAQLVGQFFDALQAGDTAQVTAMLAPAFQLVRATGARFDAANYLDNLPAYEAYRLDDLYVTRAGDVMVVTYSAATDTTLDGGEADFGASAPRLTVFQQIDGAWKLLAHASFAPQESDAATSSQPAADSKRAVVRTDAAPAPIGPYAQAIRAGELIYTSGELGLDPATGNLAEGVEAQARQALANLDAILTAAGSSPADVVKTTIYLADINDFVAVNKIYAEVFKDAPPARSTVQVAALPRDARVMIDIVAVASEE